jgi:hypothetical protein
MAVSELRYAQFFYRSNPDGTTDSICGICFNTVVTARLFAQLKTGEMVHKCSPGLAVEPHRAA